MNNIILRLNAIPVYGFLSAIHAQGAQDRELQKQKILDCGAGGPIPPLALFHQHGFEGWGIDISRESLGQAQGFCQENGIELHLHQGDMRQMPFEDESFDCVYEHFSMCHLSKKDTALAVGEMHRVLTQGGLCFLGFISSDTWPKSLFGQEDLPGEYWGEEGGKESVLHSMFSDDEADGLVSDFQILEKQKQVYYLRDAAENTSQTDWAELYAEAQDSPSLDDWQVEYVHRANAFRYVHLYYHLKKF